MKISLATTCGGRFEHLRQTLPAMVRATHDAAPAVEVEAIVVDFGPTPGVETLMRLFPSVRRVPVIAAQWNFGKARNAGLHVATGDIFVNVDCDTFVDAESLEAVNDWLERQGQKSYVRSRNARGAHGRFAFFTAELIELGGFNEDDLDGAAHVMGADIADVYDRADGAGFSSRTWPGKFQVIDHPIDRLAAAFAGWPLRARIKARRKARRRAARKKGARTNG